MGPPADQPDNGEVESDWSETVAAVFRALEGVDGDISPQLARSVQATINVVKHVGREFGLLTENETREAFGPGEDSDPYDFTLRYRGQTLYPGFLFEPSPAGDGSKSAAAHEGPEEDRGHVRWNGSDVVLWMTSPTTRFADQGRPVDHLDEPSRVLTAFEDEAGTQW